MIETEPFGNVTVLRLAYGKANVMDTELCRALTASLDEQRSSASTHAVVLTGSGSIFSAGVDLKRVLDGGAAYVATFLPALREVFDTLFAFPKPVVAAVNGHAIAGGCVLVCAADHRVMARGTGRIGVPELLVGVPFPSIALEIMRHVITPANVAHTLYGGATNEPAAALALGLVDELVDGAELLPHTIAHAERLAALPASAFETTKRQLREPAIRRAHETLARLDGTVQQLWEAPATMARIRAYVDRTLKRS